jgi:hypothetical protein
MAALEELTDCSFARMPASVIAAGVRNFTMMLRIVESAATRATGRLDGCASAVPAKNKNKNDHLNIEALTD